MRRASKEIEHWRGNIAAPKLQLVFPYIWMIYTTPALSEAPALPPAVRYETSWSRMQSSYRSIVLASERAPSQRRRERNCKFSSITPYSGSNHPSIQPWAGAEGSSGSSSAGQEGKNCRAEVHKMSSTENSLVCTVTSTNPLGRGILSQEHFSCNGMVYGECIAHEY